MGLAQPQLRTIHIGAKRSHSILALCTLGFIVALTPQAKAGFIGNYAPSQFTLTNTNADGCVADPALLDCFAVTPVSAQSIALIGGNTGSGEPGTTDFVVTAAAAGVVQFQYSYSSLDFPYQEFPTPIGDYAGYLIGNLFHQLATVDGQSSLGVPITFSVSAGELFGFRVVTADNIGEPGILTISEFSAPTSASVPEPGTASVMLAAGAIIVAWRQLSRTGRNKKRTA